MEYQAIILASGESNRSSLNYNKVLYKINEKPLIFHSALNFINDDDCQKIVIACKENEIETIKEIFNNNNKIVYVKGGSSRQKSVANALKLIDSDYVIIHDGARPFFSSNLLNNLKEKMMQYKCVIPVINIVDTIKIVKDNVVVKTINREEVKRVQTPQGFNSKLLKQVHSLAKIDDYSDDSFMVEELSNEIIYTIPGEEKNKKYTNKEDF